MNERQPPTPSDLLDLWRQQAAQMEQRWNEFLNQMMGSDAFSQTMARSMEGMLGLQSTYTRGMEQYLRALNIPTRTDIVDLAERLGRLEQQFADLLVALKREPPPAAAEAPRPARQRDSQGRYLPIGSADDPTAPAQ